MKDLIIVGAGGFGRELLSYALDIERGGMVEWKVKGFINDILGALDNYEINYPILGPINGHIVQENAVYICAIGDSKARLSIGRELQLKGAKFINLIHSSVTIRERIEMGVGNIFCPYSGVNPDVKFGDFVLVNGGSWFGHDCIIEDGVTVSSNCDITGNCILEEGVFLGTRSVIIPKRKIGKYAKISAGAVVFTHVKPERTMIGNPAKILK
ncbi:NeuD/PglB/VioB family sugar acetyltransferase [Lysinibacillus sp. FSL R7-0073]|uniref:NeuD/PglB/VioB family sugar acetyltransferase n=1 Tax=Lysinibacillus TaxID=400634 RepID=UPI002E1C3ED5|nr:NeuD/PglB/VioB family sugar acetyltransferase [Lysinibacillus fusiformis]MED4888205.1 NeuD/PglB/VioB family sugar acetyltransferase [Lysinibacillus fusiformis]